MYLHLRVVNKQAIRKIMDFGLTVEVVTHGKKKKKAEIVFPIERKNRAPALKIDRQNRPDKTDDKRERRPSLEDDFEMKLVNIRGEKKTQVISSNDTMNVSGQIM